MNVNELIQKIKNHPEAGRIGMIVSHLGVVRATSRDGQGVTEIEVVYDHGSVENIIKNIKEMPGIIEVLVETSEGTLKIGDDILAVAVGGDIREHVFPALMETVNRIKAEAVRKKEIMA